MENLIKMHGEKNGSNISIRYSSVQFSHSVVSDSLRYHELQHVYGVAQSQTRLTQLSSISSSSRPPCPSPIPEFTQTHVHRVGGAIQPSHPPSSPSPPAPNPSQHQSFPMSQLFHEVAKVLEFQL